MAGGTSNAARGAPPIASASSLGSADSYSGDDTRRFLHQWNETRDLYSRATREVGHLELCLEATQAALSAADGETSAARAMLADADARVASKTLPSSRISHPKAPLS
jgi:hypothetical protein